MEKALIFTRNGRRIAFKVSGQKGGNPTLYLNGAGMDGSLTFDNQKLINNKIELFSYDRPGFGESDFDIEKSFQSIYEDILVLLKELKISKINAIAFSQGAPFLYYLCLKEIIGKTIVVSGQDDLNYPKTKNQLSDDTRFFNNSITQNDSFDEHLKSSFNIQGFLEFIISTSSEVDRKVYLEKNFCQSYKSCLNNGMGKSFDAYIQDLKLCLSEWPFNIEEIPNRVLHIYGDQDSSPVHSPDFGKTLSLRNKKFDVDVLKNSGAALIWTHADYILGKLSEGDFQL